MEVDEITNVESTSKRKHKIALPDKGSKKQKMSLSKKHHLKKASSNILRKYCTITVVKTNSLLHQISIIIILHHDYFTKSAILSFIHTQFIADSETKYDNISWKYLSCDSNINGRIVCWNILGFDQQYATIIVNQHLTVKVHSKQSFPQWKQPVEWVFWKETWQEAEESRTIVQIYENDKVHFVQLLWFTFRIN